ncbi:MAG: Delta-60 repeat protein/Por secretion system C-terminal sorting [Hymenobacter sp.]|nr:Delta-60 repeat protein/Por secretion system C-terminal sorting [Hymenobacter sp.]
MKNNTLLLIGICLLPVSWPTAHAQTLDPSFAPGTYYAPGAANSVLEQADGKRVVLGRFSRANGSPVNSLVRYTAAGAVDAAFQQNLGASSQAYRADQLANGQLLLTAYTNVPLVAGGITRNGLLRLNADGTGDATFDPGTGPSVTTGGYSAVDYALPLANGQFLVGGFFDHFNGVAATNVVRLNANGSVDTSFSASLSADDEIETIVALPGGKYLVGGYTQNTTTSTFHALARLNADGSFDTTFNANLDINDEANYLLLQPDGKILVAGYLTPGGIPASATGLLRLLPDGTPDNTFAPSTLAGAYVSSFYGHALELQPDGKILALVAPGNPGGNTIVRLNANGTADNSFQAGTGNGTLNSITRLASGAVLAAGSFTNFGGALDRPVVQFTSSGALDASFSPLLQNLGSVSSIVRQADGKLVIGGYFSEVNGQPARRLARLNTNGTVDATYNTGVGFDDSVGELALQPDGKVLVIANSVVQRQLTTGARDNSFTPPSLAGSNLYHLVLQPDGRVLVGGNSGYANGAALSPPLLRLLADGTRDASFAPAAAGAGRFLNVSTIALQPNGKLLVGGNFAPTTTTTVRTVARLESTGALDASFANTPFVTPNTATGFNSLTVQPDGKVLVGGQFSSVGGTARVSLARLNADGTHDTGFVPPFTSGTVNSLLLQPNGRLLVGGSVRGSSVPNNLARLLPTGQLDASFGATAVPNSSVLSLLAQPDGTLIIGGSFTTIGGQASAGVARLTNTNVLHVAAPQAVAARTQAWPVPAHATLTVAPDASAHPQALDLLDVLGRAVRHQNFNGATPATLPLENLPAGMYVLRVRYAEGAVTRRVQVQ